MRSLDVFSHPHPHPHPLLECCPPRCGSLSRWWHGDHTRGILSDVALFLLVLRKRSDSESTHLTQVNQTCRVFWVSVDLSPTYDRYIYRRTGNSDGTKLNFLIVLSTDQLSTFLKRENVRNDDRFWLEPEIKKIFSHGSFSPPLPLPRSSSHNLPIV